LRSKLFSSYLKQSSAWPVLPRKNEQSRWKIRRTLAKFSVKPVTFWKNEASFQSGKQPEQTICRQPSQTPMSRLSKIVWISVIAAAGAGGYYWWQKRQPDTKKLEYRTATVSRGDIIQSVSANGQLSPVVTVAVGSQVSGNIEKIYVDFNAKVTNGQLVAELDPATYEARLIQAEAEMANARAQQKLAQVNAQRAENLYKQKLIPQADYDQAMAELQQREATVKMREAALKSAQVDLARTRIFSPIDGTVISRNVDVGQTVQASFTAPTLFAIANDLSKMEIAAMVSEADIGNVEEKQEVTFRVEAFPERTFEGKVAQVRNQPTTNQNVVTYATIVDVNNPDLKLKPGMTANVSITTGKKEKVLKVPNAALRFRPPEGAIVKSNAVAASAGGTNVAGKAAASAEQKDDGLPPGIPAEFRQRMLQRYDKDGDGRLDDTERAAMEEARRQRRAQGGGGGGGGGGGEGMMGGGGGGGGERRRESSSPFRTVYLISTNVAAKVELQPTQVRIGISDGTSTEILSGLKDGDVIATGTIGGPPATAAAQPGGASPFGGPFGGGGGRRF
jgi:HlyD family secretion protein